MKTRVTQCCLLLAFLLAPLTRAGEPPKTAEDVLAFATQKLAAYRTWSADFAETIGDDGPVLRGRIFFKVPGLSRTETRMPSATIANTVIVIVDTNAVQWQEMTIEDRKQVVRTPLNPATLPNLLNPWAAHRRLMNLRLVSSETVWIIEGEWKPETLQNPGVAAQNTFADRLRFHVNQQDGFTYRVDYFRNGRAVKRLDYTNVRFNEKLDAALFTYRPPPGAEVLELNEPTTP